LQFEGSSENPAELGVHELAVVRGDFRTPFMEPITYLFRRRVEELENAGNNGESSTSSSGHKFRSRRAAKHGAIRFVALSKAHRKELAIHCQRLLSTLSLPAVLLVHFRVVGRGTCTAGDAIHRAVPKALDESDAMEESTLLGYITTGQFSPSRGCVHGVAVIGARLYLEALIAMQGHKKTHTIALVKQLDGQETFELDVQIQSRTQRFRGALGLVR
jgi:hypothetical protein